ncbi:MAG: lytic murein transglycosylase, partial [Myxococcota bacterium]
FRLCWRRNQTEFNHSTLAYINRQLGDDGFRVAMGREIELSPEEIAAIEAQGADVSAVRAVWGAETTYGTRMGGRNIFQAMGTVGFAREDERWDRQILAAFQVAEDEGIDPATMVGSWAGAMGHTQFMPTSIRAYAVDGDGDESINVVESRSDALASAASYLAAHGWDPDEPAVREVRLPSGFDFGQVNGETERTVGEWRAQGVEFFDSEGLSDSARVDLFMPDRHAGPVLARFGNYDSYFAYNRADSYATTLSVMREQFDGVEFGPWTREPPLSQDEREFLQELLDVSVDGVIGGGTGRAYRAEIARLGIGDGWSYPTRATLHQIAEARGRSAEIPQAPLSRQERITLQEHLADDGTYTAAIDGVIGRGSMAAVSQSAAGLGLAPDASLRTVLEAFER